MDPRDPISSSHGSGLTPRSREQTGTQPPVRPEERLPLDRMQVRTATESDWQRDARRDRVVTRLRNKGIVSDDVIRTAWDEWIVLRERDMRVPLWRVLALDKHLDSEVVFREASLLYAFSEADVDLEEALSFLSKHEDRFTEADWDEMVEHFVLPIGIERDMTTGDTKWLFVTHDPTRPEIHQILQGLRLRRFEVLYATEATIGTLISDSFLSRNQYLENIDGETAVDLGNSYNHEEEILDEEALEAEISRSHLINLFEASLLDAVRMGASDIHIYPNKEGHINIRMRIDGELEDWRTEDRFRPEAFLAVVKDNSTNVDRFDRDTAQDGFIQRWIDDALIRFRVSVLPIASRHQNLHAESIVIRVLDDRKVLTDLRQIGLLDDAYTRFQEAIRQPHGMVILTGPTGSGKSTTLVAALHQVVTPKVNVLTVEDPVEYLMDGVRQIKLSHKLDLEGALRAILRHDPDVVMVGEMRDQQTAELAIKLANTGHLTFSTLHTNDAPAAVSRLYKMGVEPFLIAYAINIVVAQRLIRKLCSACRIPDPNPDFAFLRHIGFTDEDIYGSTLYQAGGHKNCRVCKGSGYKGRRAIAETMLFTQKVRNLIMASEDLIDEDKLRQVAIEEGMTTLQSAARQLVLAGETSVEEAIRVTGT
jgi:type IV pilus assembly protein PilB